MRILWIALLGLASCTQPGSFCALYVDVNMTRAGAEALVPVDRPAAERIAVNEETAAGCP